MATMNGFLQRLFARQMEAFQREMGSVLSALDAGDERQMQEAINAVLEQQGARKAKTLGAIPAEQIDAAAVKLLASTDSQEKKERMLDVPSKHLPTQILEVSEILTDDLH